MAAAPEGAPNRRDMHDEGLRRTSQRQDAKRTTSSSQVRFDRLGLPCAHLEGNPTGAEVGSKLSREDMW